jgi:hypothetical protein
MAVLAFVTPVPFERVDGTCIETNECKEKIFSVVGAPDILPGLSTPRFSGN